MSNYCKLLWSSVTVNFPNQSVRSCCLSSPIQLEPGDNEKLGTSVFQNHPSLVNSRSQLVLESIAPPDCSKCYEVERNLGHSMRLDNLTKDVKENKTLFELENPGISKLTKRVDIEISRTCNAKCIYCNRFYSTLWEIEDIKAGIISKGDYQERFSDEFEINFWHWLESVKENLDCINFLGGEPLVEKRYFEALKKLSQFEYTKVRTIKPRLDTVSNLNVHESKIHQFLELLPELTPKYRINIDSSMEATMERAEYIRFGVSYEKWLKNMDLLLKSNNADFEVASQMSINALCVTDLQNHLKVLLEFRKKYNVFIPLRHNIVSWPSELSPYILPHEYARYIFDAAEFLRKNDDGRNSEFEPYTFNTWSNYANFLENIGQAILKNKLPHPELGNMYKWLSENDRKRGSNFSKVFPEYAATFKLAKEMYHSSHA